MAEDRTTGIAVVVKQFVW